LAAATVFALSAWVLAMWSTWRETAVQGWSALGLAWLALDQLASVRALGPASAAGAAAFGLALAARRWPGLAALGARARLRLLAHPLSVVLALALAFVLPGVVARGTRPVPARQAPNVLFVLIDTWRADHTGFLGYERNVSPYLDRLAAEGVVFERAIAQSSWTKPSVATLLTGLTPSQHHAVSQAIPEQPVRAFRLHPRLTTFIELLRGKGWQTAMWSDNPNITPPIGFDQGAERFRDYFHEPCCPERCGELPEILSDVDEWFRTERDESRPFCLYVHVMDAHYPFDPPQEFAGRFDTNPSDLQLTGPIVHDYMTGKRSEANLSEQRLASLIARYDEELLAVDQRLGAFLERVRRAHPNTVIVVSGDHGEEFYEHGNLGHSHALWQELVHVPLLLWAPGLAPARVATQVRLMDVCPTILELTGNAGALPGMQGESLLPVIGGRESADRPAPMEVGGDQKPCWQWRGLSDGTTKLLRRERDLPTLHPIPALLPGDDATRPSEFLFDLARDPGERENLAPERPASVAGLFAELERRGWYVPPETLLGLKASALTLDPSFTDELSALGYGGGGDEAQSP
jgi:arylsulfatase A-like enzyme